jgi:hypothetical protein
MALSKYTAEQLAHWKRLRARGMKTGDPRRGDAMVFSGMKTGDPRRGDAMVFSGMKTAWIPLEEWQPSANNPTVRYRFKSTKGADKGKTYDWTYAQLQDTLFESAGWDDAIVAINVKNMKPGQTIQGPGGTLTRLKATNPARKTKAAKRPAKQPKKTRGKTSTVTTVMTTKTTKTTRRGNPDGRHYGIDEWPEFVLEGVLESAGASTSDTSITPQLKKAIERYESELYDVLMEWTKKVPPMTDEVWVDSTPYDIFATLSGEGVWIWDGRWDHLYNEREIKALINYLQHSKVSKAVDDTGGGWLNDAFEHVAYERGGSQENPGRKKNPTGPGHQIAARLLHGD